MPIGSRDAFVAIDATDLDGQSGITDFGGYIGSLDDGDWVRYDRVDFASGADLFRASIAVPSGRAGQRIELHLDDLSRSPIGVLVPSSTGGWGAFAEQETAIGPVTGVHDLYVLVAGSTGAGNIASFVFANGLPPADPSQSEPPPNEPLPDDPDVNDPPPAACALTASGPVTATADGQVIQNLSITSSGSQAIQVNGRRDVVIRNVRIRHSDGVGIRLTDAPGAVIENVSVELTGGPKAGPNSSAQLINIFANRSDDLTVRNVRLVRGSSGIYLVQSNRSRLSFIEGHDFRGPFPRGQIVQWNDCDDGLLEDFSVEGDLATIWSEDNINAYKSNKITVRRGLVDGNNAPSGIGVIADAGSSDMLVEDVDAVHQGNGCFGAYTGSASSDNVRFRRVRCRDTHCSGVGGRGKPSSGGLIVANHPSNTNVAVEASSYFNHCRQQAVWDASDIAPLELTARDFTPRSAIRAELCWEANDGGGGR